MGRRRARGSWTLRIAGIAVVVLLAGGGATAYLLASRPAARGARPLPSRVTSVQTVGLGAQPPATAGGGALRQLIEGPGGLEFSPVPPATQAAGNPVWTADLMAGGSYVFIYSPDGRCLAAAGRRPGAALSLQHCNLGPDQRWHELAATVKADGRVFGQFRDMGSGQCVSAASSAAGPASLARCNPAQPWEQLLAFW